MKKTVPNLNKIIQYCDECMGEGDVSECCGDVVEDSRCLQCGRFCRVDRCGNCEGRGFNEYHVGDEVEIFVCGWSPEYLREELYRPKDVNDTKRYTGKITNIIDNFKVEVKIKWNGIHKIDIEDLITI